MSVFQWVIDLLVIGETVGMLVLGTIGYLVYSTQSNARRMARNTGEHLFDTTQYTVPEDSDADHS